VILDLDENLVKAIHPDYPTPIEAVNQKYRDHTQEVVIAIVTWFDEQVPRHLVELAIPEGTLVDLLAKANANMAAVDKIHQPWANTRWGQQRCAGCGQSWPCKTNSAVHGWPDQANRANSAPAVDPGDKKP
jgi:hypothetical protein